MRKHWNKNLTVKENYGALGLSFSVKPRMMQSTEGSKLMDEATR